MNAEPVSADADTGSFILCKDFELFLSFRHITPINKAEYVMIPI